MDTGSTARPSPNTGMKIGDHRGNAPDEITQDPLEALEKALKDRNLFGPRATSSFEQIKNILEPFVGQLKQRNDTVFTTRTDDKGVYNIQDFVTELEQGGPSEDYCAIGFAGHNVMSQALHFYYVKGPIAILLQIPTVGRDNVKRCEAWPTIVENVLKFIKGFQDNEAWVKDKRLVVVESYLQESNFINGVQTVTIGKHDEGKTKWGDDIPVPSPLVKARLLLHQKQLDCIKK